MNPGFGLDAFLYRGRKAVEAQNTRLLQTPQGAVRVFDSGGSQPPVVLVPDGPNVIEHYAPLIDRLRSQRRVVCVDLPGFGFSFPRADYHHALAQGAVVLNAVLDALDLRGTTLVATCVNGFYAIAAAKLDSERRIDRLVLAQTPSLQAMRHWTQRIVPTPIRVPVLGQAINFAQRRKVAAGWYHAALARREDRPRFKDTADDAFEHGACYCFASVVQGMAREPERPAVLEGVTIPATLIWGDADRSHKTTLPESLRELLPQVRIERWAQAGHFPDLEGAEGFAKVVLAA